MDSFFWWSGVIAWAALGGLGSLWIADDIIDFVVNSVWTKREFLAFVADRLKRRT
jgi:hypothetical protein